MAAPNLDKSEVVDFPSNKTLPSRDASKQDPDAKEGRDERHDDDHALFMHLCELFRDGKMKLDDWRKDAVEDFEFAAGHQYSAKDLEVAKQRMRPTVVFDRVGRNVSAVCGLEINNRGRAATYPREEGDVDEAEIGSNILEWVEDETSTLEEDSDAFRDMIVCGIGLTDTAMDYLNYDGGMPAGIRVSPLVAYWDPYAKRRNLVDRSWDAVARTVPIKEARRLCPGWDDVMLHAGWAGVEDDITNAGIEIDNKRYETDRKKGSRGDDRQRVTLIEMQWREVVSRFLVDDTETGTQKETSVELGRRMVETFPNRFKGTEKPTYVYYRAILGACILKKSRLDAQKGFTREFMTGYRDETRGCFYGLVRAMKDPQRAANALYSESVAMMKTGTKNGWAFERTAVKDVRRFERDQAKNGANLIFEDGALSGARAQPLSPSPPPTHTHELLGMSLDQVQQSVGIPLESVAMATGTHAGQTALLESERRKAGMNLLATFFAAKRQHLQRRSKLILRYVHEFMRDGRLMRVVNDGQVKNVALWLEDEDIRRYDVIVDDSPTSPDARERTWMVIRELMPFMSQMGTPPELMIELLPYIPNFPTSLASKFAEHIEKMAEMTPEKQRAQERAERAEEAEVRKVEGDAFQKQTAGALNVAKVQDMGGRLTLDATEQMRETALAKATPGTVPFREFA